MLVLGRYRGAGAGESGLHDAEALNPQEATARVAHLAGPAQCCRCLSFGGSIARITNGDGKAAQEDRAAPQSTQRRMLRQQADKKLFEVIRLGDECFSADCWQ